MIISAKWVLPIDKEPIEDGSVVIEGAKIKDIGKTEKLLKKYGKDSQIDTGLSAILPGFVDCHTHLEYSVFRGVCDDLSFGEWKIQQEEKSKILTKKDWVLSAKLGAQEALRSGITTVADVTSSGASLDAILEAGLRAKVFFEVYGFKTDKKKINDAAKTIENWQQKTKGSLVEIGISPYAAYATSPQLLQEVATLAAEKNLLSCVHVSGSKDEYDFVKYGSGPLAHRYKEILGWPDVLWQPMGTSPVKYLAQWDVFKTPTVAVHCIHVDDHDLDMLVKNEVKVVHCPRCASKLGMGIAPLKKFKQRGLQIGLGTDSPASNNTMDLFEEMRHSLLLQRAHTQSMDGLAALDFVRMATLGGAEVLSMDKNIGSLTSGKRADMMVVDLSQSYHLPTSDPYSAIVYTCSGSDVFLTLVDGKIKFKRDESDQLDKKLFSGINNLREKLVLAK